MALESSIQTIITGLVPTGTFKLASKFRADLESFDVAAESLPYIVLDNELPKNNTIQTNYSISKDTRIVMYFLNKDTPDNTDIQTNAIQAAMELIADRTALQIYQLESIKPVGNQKYKITPVFHYYNSDLSGVRLEMNVSENVIVTCRDIEE